jgi:hypothetical protein
MQLDPSFQLLDSLPECPHEDLRIAARLWEKANSQTVRVIDFSKPGLHGESPPAWVCYASCGRHDFCQGRYKFTRVPGEQGQVWYRPHSSESSHAAGDRVARKDAKNPVPRHVLEQAKQMAVDNNKRPVLINAELESPLPGRSLQSSVAKRRKKSLGDPVTVQSLQQWLEKRRLNDDDEVPKQGCQVLWTDVRQVYIGFVFAFGNLLHRFLDILEQCDIQPRIVTQCDYTGDLLLCGAHLGVIGLPVYHRSKEGTDAERRWRKALVPGCLVVNPFEDADHYVLGFQWLRHVLIKMCAQRGLDCPEWGQCNGDWTKSLRKHYQMYPGKPWGAPIINIPGIPLRCWNIFFGIFFGECFGIFLARGI